VRPAARPAGPPTNRFRRPSLQIVVGAVAVLVLTALSMLTYAAISGAFASGPRVSTAGQACAGPALPGSTVDVTLTDMGAMMRGGPHGPVMRGPMRGGDWPTGTMSASIAPTRVPAGTVSLRVHNLGMVPHELLVLPLPVGQAAGQLPIGSDGTVDETGSLGEASRSCGAGEGDGILPATTGWLTITLAPGRYELLCNKRGHYRAGMFAELDVVQVG
jgi:uncharacterized cupredoxin-like copper-binding protein